MNSYDSHTGHDYRKNLSNIIMYIVSTDKEISCLIIDTEDSFSYSLYLQKLKYKTVYKVVQSFYQNLSSLICNAVNTPVSCLSKIF